MTGKIFNHFRRKKESEVEPTDFPEERFSKTTYKVLKKSGWFPGRHVFSNLILPKDFNLLESAKPVLDEFGGLHLEFDYSQRFSKRTHYDTMWIVIDPMRVADEGQEIIEHTQEIGHPLYPLGELFDQNLYQYDSKILIDDLGRVFITPFWETMFVGDTFEIALDNMVLGNQGKELNKNGEW